MITGNPPTDDAEFTARLADIEGAADAEESLRSRVAHAIAEDDGLSAEDWGDTYYTRADAAIRVMRGDDA